MKWYKIYLNGENRIWKKCITYSWEFIYEDKEINLPERKTKYSAGYDIEAAEDVIIPSFKKGINPTLVKTGIKVYMPDDEVVLLYNRSSNPKKKGLIMANSVGVIDKDYYGNPDNDGHIMFAFYNIKEEDIEIKKGEAIGQALSLIHISEPTRRS